MSDGSAGFNHDLNLALVYIASMGWTDFTKSFGDYIYLARSADTWSIVGRVRTWALMPGPPKSGGLP